MLKNSQILPLFGLGLILSTSPLFTLLDSSIVSSETVELKKEEEQEKGEESEVAEDTQSSSTTTSIEPTEEPQPKEPSNEISTKEEDTHSKEDSPKSEESLSPTEDLSSQQQEPKESTKDTQSESKEIESTSTTHSQVTESVTPEVTTTESPSTPTSTEPFKVATKVSSSPKTSGTSPSTTPTNKGSQPSKNSKSTDSLKGRWKRREYVGDYTGNLKTTTPGLHSVTFKDIGSKFLYSIDKDVDFSIPSKLVPQQFQRVPVENIHINLLKSTAWSKSSTRSVDEYEKISQDNVKELFDLVESKKDQEKKLRQLLVSLSNRRAWFYHEKKTTFTSELKTAEIVWKGKDKENELEINIKYFDKFEDLKKYIDYKIDLCTNSRGPCLADQEELTIIDQDKKSFFEEVKK